MRKKEKTKKSCCLVKSFYFPRKTLQRFFLTSLNSVHAAVQIVFLNACEKRMSSQHTEGAHEAVVPAQAWLTSTQELYYDAAT